VSTYSFQAEVNVDRLLDELEAVGLDVLVDGITASETSVDVSTLVPLDAGQEAGLSALIAAHDPLQKSVSEKIELAKQFGREHIEKYQRIFIKEGVVQAGMAHLMALALADAVVLAQGGNLYALDVALSLVTPIPTFLEASRLTEMRNEVRAYLGMPLI